MIKVLNATIALITMKGFATNTSFAQIAEILMFRWIELGQGIWILNECPMLNLNLICRIYRSR